MDHPMIGAGETAQSAIPDHPPFDISERTALFADRCVRAAMALPSNGVAWELQRQFVRSSCSVGANLAEAKGVNTKPEFRQRVSVALREAHETLYWLERIANAELVDRKRLTGLMDKANQLISILTKILKSARGKE